ncbi:NADH dehydrogenase [ubiquinone] iron-sulfur protein 5-like [Paramacrobiotus metropolitanus]|uniref:NADH dehydrogenase [ubiquinone] iron-sulfur protein 5-like n=1 Tax=Paramacrobiotus metropolitanus TaxID=2943436 RepID=UPI0024462FFF|nr:NADH dehydrogenase [ubiquinone] iron-sulfur protein 5-like [Paramacrobiotus metropolitanus]
MSLIRTPFSDLSGNMFTFQSDRQNPLCRAIEIQLYKCLEAAGVPNWRKTCKDEYEDYVECVTRRKTKERLVCMHNERARQFLAGKIPDEYLPLPPRFAWRPPVG